MAASRNGWVAAAAVLALVAAACGDGDQAEGPATPTSTATTTPETPAAQPTTGQPTGAGGFAQLARQGFQAQARVTYQVTGTGTGTGQTLTFSSDGESSAILYDTGRVIATADTTIVCSEGGGAQQCIEFSGTGAGNQSLVGAFAAPLVGLTAAFEEGAQAVGGFTVTGERQIAGRTATCATFDPSALPTGDYVGEATLCVADDAGIVLLFEVTSPDGTLRMEAVEVGEPQASDFEPPAPPQQAPAVPSG